MQEPSDHVVQVVDSLLYQRDDSVPNQESVSSLDDDFSTLAISTDNKKKKKKKSSLASKFDDRAINGSLLEIKNAFSPSSSNGDNHDDDTSAGGDQWEASDSDVAKLRRELKEAKMDLEIEKSSKKKREKSLLRLAKELSKRTASEKAKDKTIEELEETIADLQQRLEMKTKMVMLEIPELRARLEEKTNELHRITSLQSKTVSMSSTSRKSTLSFYFPLLVLFSVCGVGIVIPLAKHSNFRTKNFVCSAIPPGMVLDTSIPQVYATPFWVPSAYKRSVHSALCADRPFTTVNVDQSKVSIVTEDSKKNATHKAPGGVAVGLDSRMKLVETKKNKPLRVIPTPWCLDA